VGLQVAAAHRLEVVVEAVAAGVEEEVVEEVEGVAEEAAHNMLGCAIPLMMPLPYCYSTVMYDQTSYLSP
jgi:hypothetical protein